MQNNQTFADYEMIVEKTTIYPDRGNNLAYPALGLAGETGEVCEKLKKIIRDKGGIVSAEDRLAMLKELGDVLWYVGALASELKSSISEVAGMNSQKLLSRLERNKLSGSGDNR